ncbi:MAG: hypothetical protein WAM97_19730 [Acidimicrobiales bacterium]
MAVGFRLNGAGDEVALAELWNGTNWSSMKGAVPPGAQDSGLSAVTCISASDCIAVGLVDAAPLAELWNGTSWTVESVPTTAVLANFEGVSCASAEQCVAVGSAVILKKENIEELAFAESWNGTAWSPTKVGKATGSEGALFTSVSCVSAGNCEAVGSYETESGEVTLAESWSGTSWVVQKTPATGSSQSELNAVSCPSTSDCIATGQAFPDTLAESWNGNHWSIVPTPNPGGSEASGLLAVSCTSGAACMAVGDYSNSTGADVTLAMSWNGETWVVQPSVSPSPIDSGLFSVSCTAQSACTAVGSSVGSKNPGLLLVEVWNGATWSAQHAFQKRTLLGAGLYNVDCTSTSFCMSVGVDLLGEAIADIWNGSSWNSTPPPAVNGSGGLYDVTCLTNTDCIAVGGGEIASDTDGFAEQWNGRSWTVMQSPPGSGALESVSCTSATACIAVGVTDEETGLVPLAESWNGTAWTVMNLPSVGAGSEDTQLYSVSCGSASSCVAVGVSEIDESDGTIDSPLIYSWNGTSWSTEISAARSPADLGLTGVSCTSATNCMATGYFFDRLGSPQAYSEASNGTTWTSEKMPSPSGGVELYGLQCSGPDACVTVGGGIKGALAEGWNGSAWSVEKVVNPPGSGTSTYLNGVDCASPTACTAVGDYTNKSGAESTLAEAN